MEHLAGMPGPNAQGGQPGFVPTGDLPLEKNGSQEEQPGKELTDYYDSRLRKFQVCQLVIEEEINAALDRGEEPAEIGRNLKPFIEKCFDGASIPARTLEQRARRTKKGRDAATGVATEEKPGKGENEKPKSSSDVVRTGDPQTDDNQNGGQPQAAPETAAADIKTNDPKREDTLHSEKLTENSQATSVTEPEVEENEETVLPRPQRWEATCLDANDHLNGLQGAVERLQELQKDYRLWRGGLSEEKHDWFGELAPKLDKVLEIPLGGVGSLLDNIKGIIGMCEKADLPDMTATNENN